MLSTTEISPSTRAHFAVQSRTRHVAIIMDGNRRWALARNLPSITGHQQGLRQLLNLIPHFKDSGVEIVTLFGFSSANWQREEIEVTSLMRLADHAVRCFVPICVRNQISIEVIGRKDRLPKKLVRGIQYAQRATARGKQRLRVAIDYSSRQAIVAAAGRVRKDCGIEEFSRHVSETCDVDLLIRTGKEQRLSDFLLWECAFAELYFPDIYWPDFTITTLDAAICWYQQRHRRFGA